MALKVHYSLEIVVAGTAWDIWRQAQEQLWEQIVLASFGLRPKQMKIIGRLLGSDELAQSSASA